MNNPLLDPQDYPSSDSNQNDDSDIQEKISPRKRREIQKLFFILLAIGLVIGTIVSVGIVKLMNHFGLTEKTPQFESIQR